LEIHNTGITTLRSQGRWRSAVGYRWWSVETMSFISSTPRITALLQDVAPAETVKLRATFQTPEAPGKYLLIVELFSRNFDWYSRMGIVPAIVETNIQRGIGRTVGQTDLAAIYNRGRDAGTLTAAVSRAS